MSLNAYHSARAMTERPRAAEQRLMREITKEMIGARLSGQLVDTLMPALHRNREVWTAFAAACGARGNLLPDELRAGVISLALWVDRYTSDVAAGRGSIDDLIDVNYLMIEGLAASAAEALH